jgi:hypothetical protein
MLGSSRVAAQLAASREVIFFNVKTDGTFSNHSAENG